MLGPARMFCKHGVGLNRVATELCGKTLLLQKATRTVTARARAA